jgi:hypothetical protein
MDNKFALCVLTVTPLSHVVERLERLARSAHGVDVYMMCDRTHANETVNGIRYIHVTDEESANNGYVNAACGTIDKECTAWDKAMYHFTKVDTSYEFVWFLEDDVYVPDGAFEAMHDKYVIQNKNNGEPGIDYVTAHNSPNLRGEETTWSHWKCAYDMLAYPMYKSMVCAVGMSRKAMDTVKKYVEDNWTMVFVEVMFNTLVMQNGFNLVQAPELSTIHYQYEWTLDDIKKQPHNLFHPVKHALVC